ncbi:hypothetical protein ACGF8B_03555 [Streptomyces sp. NPDC047917]|uniref:hypothetical protein n=1 Tax=Streptomyces sp. NPDC047917 TaxID=3365491 RepID=UPI00371AB47F
MDAIQQHMIDSYRAAQRGELPPPLPGRHDWGVVREARERRRFDAVIAGRPAHGRVWAALRSLLWRIGKAGKPGKASRSGELGESGEPGKPGKSGKPGEPGKSGESAKPGKCRPSGA